MTLTCAFATLAATPTALVASVSLATLLTAQWHLTRARPLLGLILSALSPLAAPLSAAVAVATLLALFTSLSVPVQLTLGSALFLIPCRRIII